MQNDFVKMQNSLDKQIVDKMKFFESGNNNSDKEKEIKQTKQVV